LRIFFLDLEGLEKTTEELCLAKNKKIKTVSGALASENK
jgi:hypothetical protein